jgi:hypothetical protein
VTVAEGMPTFDDEGYLPPGIHPATWTTVAERFGQTAARRRLLAGLRGAARLLAAAGCRRIWLAGSFVTDIEGREARPPRDIDVGWEIADVDLAALARLDPALDPLHPDYAAQRQRYGAEFFAIAEPVSIGQLDFCQHDRGGRRKGIVVVELGDERGGPT